MARVLFCAMLCLAISNGIGFADDFRVVATSETLVPGLDPATFTGFRYPVVNNLGQVAFVATYGGGEGIFSDAAGSLATVARVGVNVPGSATSFESFAPAGPLLNDAGSVAFLGTFSGGSGVFRADGGNLSTVARTGELAPGGSFNFQLFHHLSMNQSGHVSFTGFTGPTVAHLYTDVGGALAQFAGPNSPVSSNGFTTTMLNGSHSSVLSNSGEIVFIGNNGNARHGYYAGTVGGSIESIALWADPVGVGAHSLEQPSFRPTTNDSGRIAFQQSTLR